MVVKARSDLHTQLDLGYLALFLGLRVNQLVKERLQAAGFENVRESHGYVIQHLIEGERSITELARRMEVTQQAASKVVAELVELGVITMAPSADRRAKRVRLSLRGWRVIRMGRQIRGEIEARLRGVVGAAQYDSTKAVLFAGLEALGGMERVRSRRVAPPQ
jgi:DNA-binding MarR family transcriptional regulator